MAPVSESGTYAAPVVEVAGSVDVTDQAVSSSAIVASPASKWYRLRQDGTALVKYLLDSEVHTFAFSVAANAILSFIPFVYLLHTIAFKVFHSDAMVGVVNDLIVNFFPSTASHEFWDMSNKRLWVVPHHIEVFSLIMILISCTGIFLPLEVALNQAWGVAKARNYLMNQLVAFGLAILMVVLGVGSVLLSAGQRAVLAVVFFNHTDNFFYGALCNLWLAFCSGAACILFLFSIYWLLPNCKVRWRPVMRASIIVGVIWLAAKYLFALVLPHLDLRDMYGPFFVSVGLLFWAYVSGLILFAGAQYSVKAIVDKNK